MFPAKQLKFKIVSEDGGHVFQVGKPPAGHLILKTPGRLPIDRLLLTIQEQTITLAENSTILKSGETAYHFTFDKPLKPDGRFNSYLYDDLVRIQLYPSFHNFKMSEDLAKQSFNANHYSYHQLEVGYQITTSNTRYDMPQANFVWARKTIWPFVAMIIVYSAIVLIAGLEWYFLLPILVLLLICEQRITHNAYFVGLDNRVYMNEESQAFLEIIPRNGIMKFLDASLHFSIAEFKMDSILLRREFLLEQQGMVEENVNCVSGRYIIELPVPTSGYPVVSRFRNGERIVWKLNLCYSRTLLPDLKYGLEIKPEFLFDKKGAAS